MYMKREEVIRLFPERIRKILQHAYWNPQGLQEIRLRAGKPLILWQDGQEYFVAEQGFLTRHREQACIVSQEDIRRTMETVGTYSLYAYEEELKQGFLTIQGGHRVGVAGKAIMEEQKVKGLSQISCIVNQKSGMPHDTPYLEYSTISLLFCHEYFSLFPVIFVFYHTGFFIFIEKDQFAFSPPVCYTVFIYFRNYFFIHRKAYNL